MGRYYSDKKAIVEDYLRISIADLRKWGYLNSYKNGAVIWTRDGTESRVGVRVNLLASDMYVQLLYTMTYSFTSKTEAIDYKVPITTTTPNYGGERFWFACPLYKNGVQCGRRVSVLYGGKWFGCRHCHKLSYQSRNESARFRGGVFKVIAVSDKIEKLHTDMRRQYYAGKPTRTYQRILDLESSLRTTSFVR